MRVAGVVACAIGVAALLNWVLSGGLLATLIAVPVLWLLVLGLPMVAVMAILIPDRPRTVRVPVYVPDPDSELIEHVVTMRHEHEVTHVHRHITEVRVQRSHEREHLELPWMAAPQVVDGVVDRPAIEGPVVRRAISEGELNRGVRE